MGAYAVNESPITQIYGETPENVEENYDVIASMTAE